MWSCLRRTSGSAIAAVALAAAALYAQPPDHVTLGVVRSDGLMLPFATYDGGDWSVPWPGPTTGLVLPLTVADVPKKWWGAAGPDAPWKLWLPGADAPRDLALVRPVQVPIFCSTRLALATDYRGKLPAEPAPTLPKDGLAIAGAVAVKPIDALSKFVPQWKQLEAEIAPKFDRAEKQAAQSFTEWKHPFSDAQRKTYPIVLETVYRSLERTDRGTWTVSYVEAVRTFPPGENDKGCGLITYGYGWILQQEGKPPQVDLAARVTYCDREGVPFITPLGRFQLKGEAYWAYQLSSWRDEMYVVSRIRPDKSQPVVAAMGGMCTRWQMR
jgi:hypothetical protein